MAEDITLIYYNVRGQSSEVHTLNGNRKEGLLAISRRLGVWRWHETHWERANNKLYGIIFYEPLLKS